VASLSARSVSGLPEVRAGDELAALIVTALDGDELRDGEVVAIAHKVVSKSEGAIVALAGVSPSERAVELAADAVAAGQDRDPRMVQVVLDESLEVLRAERGVLICRTRQGFVCANAGVASARRIRGGLRELTGASVAVLISDSFGRAWRHGQLDVAIGLAGMQPLDDWRGRTDASGLELRATWLAVADAAAASADLARVKDSREPVVVIDGLGRFVTDEDGPGAAELLRPLQEDLFR
jgi:coenzyme F420-0:L-glutamate ligase/coenzyme F420-1:gamma-L-glutamate ligase